ncbi:MAG: LLM class F420-dependent oxidoreductase [Acidimicrobiia bacterium]
MTEGQPISERYGITIPFEGVPLPEQRAWFEEAERLGYTDFWSAEAGGHDAFTPLACAAIWTPSVRLGTAVVPAYTRGAATLAQTVASMAQLAPGRFALGIGTSSETIVHGWNGIEFDRPYQRVRDTIRFLHDSLSGEKVTHDYETFSVRGFRLAIPVSEMPPILVGALRPGMLRLGGTLGDGAIVNWLSAADVAKVVPYVGGKEVVARIFVLPSTDLDLVRFVGKRSIAAYLTVPAYAEFHRWLGRADALDGMWKAWEAGDRRAATEAIPDSLVDELIVHGTPQECRDRIREYVDRGVTTPAPLVLATGDDALAGMRSLAPTAG